MTSALKPMELDLDLTNGQLVYSPKSNFSYRLIPEGCYACVPEYQEMVLNDKIEIYGNLFLIGDLTFIR